MSRGLLTSVVTVLLLGCAANSHTTAVTERSFAAEVLAAEGPVLVDFWASWCAPCLAIAPVLDALAEEYEGRIKICKVDVDKNAELAKQFKIDSIPTLIMFRGGVPVDTRIGALGKGEFRIWFEEQLGHLKPEGDGNGA